jgi:hypothetical protein
MQDVRIHRLSLQAAAPIITCMKNHLNHYPTVAELRALEAAAHRDRTQEIARLLRAGAHAVKSLVALPAGKKVSHA